VGRSYTRERQKRNDGLATKRRSRQVGQFQLADGWRHPRDWVSESLGEAAK